MKVTFIGVPGEKHESMHMYGQDFPLNKAVDVTNPTAMRKLANHPHFKAEATAEDMKLDQQVSQDFMAAATAGMAQAHKDAMQRPHGPHALASAAPAPTAAPTGQALRSAQEYVERVEQGGGGGIPQLSEEQLEEQLKQRRAEREAREKAQQQANKDAAQDTTKQPRKEASDGDAGRTGDKDSAQAESRRATPDPQRGRAR